MWELENTYAYREQYLRVGPSIVEQLRERGPQWLWDLSYGFDPVQKADGRDFEDAFRSAGFDREGRLRGLKLYVDDSIEVLTGGRQRHAREILSNVTRSNFATESEWDTNLRQIRSSHPWNMSVFEAQDWVANIRRSKGTIEKQEFWRPCKLRPAQNTRVQDWERAYVMIGNLCIDDKGYNIHCPIRTLYVLKELTGKRFDSSEEWVRWWHENRENLFLSGDGRTLGS